MRNVKIYMAFTGIITQWVWHFLAMMQPLWAVQVAQL